MANRTGYDTVVGALGLQKKRFWKQKHRKCIFLDRAVWGVNSNLISINI